MSKPILINHISRILSLKSAYQSRGKRLTACNLDAISDGAMVYDSEKIIWSGLKIDTPDEYKSLKSYDLSGYTVTPEIVDCHTHLIFGGNRAHEYASRLNGADYQEIANSGGGILYTMNETNKSSFETLYKDAAQRIERLYSYGVGTIEIKSGYGLNYKKEKELSLIIAKLKDFFSPRVQIKNTYMAAHAVPAEFKKPIDYINQIVLPLLDELNKLNIIDAVDIFHEQGYFEKSDVEALFKHANMLGIPVKSHADEFYDNKGAILATSFNALSTDHLLRTSSDGIEALSKSDTVATMLPGTGFFLGKPQSNARSFLDAGCTLAIGSDYNPGSCHWDNVLQIASMIAPHQNYKLSQVELWAAITMNAAKALGIKNQGAIDIGLAPRFSFFKTNHEDNITYSWGQNLAITKEEIGLPF